MTGAQLIAAERKNQRTKWGDAHDDRHDDDELAFAAAHLASPLGVAHEDFARLPQWADDLATKHENDRIHELTVAGALIAAEIDRLQRAAGAR